MVLQTFGAHWTAVVDARKLDGIDDPTLPVGKPVRGLGLAVAAVSAIISYRFVLTHFACTVCYDFILCLPYSDIPHFFLLKPLTS